MLKDRFNVPPASKQKTGVKIRQLKIMLIIISNKSVICFTSHSAAFVNQHDCHLSFCSICKSARLSLADMDKLPVQNWVCGGQRS